ncbi:MAG: hypothetical protein GY950_27505, partial [bacterium]|nr:hypothetical protein [bacterium]
MCKILYCEKEIGDGVRGVSVSGDYAFVTEQGGKLRALNVSHPANPVAVADFYAQNTVSGLYVEGNNIYFPDSGGNFYLLNFTVLAPSQIGLDRETLYFGADTSGNVSGPQSFSITNEGGETLYWQVSADKSWPQISPLSGTGS